MIQARRRDHETYLRSGRRRDGGPDSGAALQLKFNSNHDPDNGRFTFTAGGASSGGGSAATARRPEVLVKPTPGKAVFGRRRDEVGIDGEVADKLNKLVEDPHASVDITLGSLPVTVRRTGGDTVAMSGSVLGRSLEMDGHLDVVEGNQAIVISKLQPKAGHDSLPFVQIVSLPETVKIARSTKTKRMIYSFVKPVITQSFRFGQRERHGAGTLYFKH